MLHYIAFLRGINLGRRRIKMEALRAQFVAMKFADVETFIASGNVIFATKSADARKLAAQIQKHLAQALGYAVDTFVRTRAEVAAVAAFQPFAANELADPGNTVHVGFSAELLSPVQRCGLLACRTDVDEFCVEGREYYWLCRIRSHESKVWASPALRALRLPPTSMRNLTTVRKLAELFPPVAGLAGKSVLGSSRSASR